MKLLAKIRQFFSKRGKKEVENRLDIYNHLYFVATSDTNSSFCVIAKSEEDAVEIASSIFTKIPKSAMFPKRVGDINYDPYYRGSFLWKNINYFGENFTLMDFVALTTR